MSSDTFKSKLLLLVNKCRKALRIYAAGAQPKNLSNRKPLADQQLETWYKFNFELLNFLQDSIKNNQLRAVAIEIKRYHDSFLEKLEWEKTDLQTKQQKLVEVSKEGDFFAANRLSFELLKLKTTTQARHAVIEELAELLELAPNIKLPANYPKMESDNKQLKIKSSKIIQFPQQKKVAS